MFDWLISIETLIRELEMSRCLYSCNTRIRRPKPNLAKIVGRELDFYLRNYWEIFFFFFRFYVTRELITLDVQKKKNEKKT